MATEYKRVAQIAKTKSKKGRLVVRSIDGLPFLLSEGATAYVVPPLLTGPRELTVSSVSLQGKDHVVSFAEVDSVDVAEKLLGHYLLMCTDDLDPELLAQEEDLPLGFAVHDADFGDLGTVSEFLEGEFQDTLVVEGPYGSVLIPYVEAFVDLVDFDQELVEVTIPRSLLELQD